MATTKVNLRGKDGKKPQPIYLIFRHKSVKLTYSTGFKVLPKYWNTDKGRVKNVTHVPNRDTINNFLNDIETECLRFAAELLQNKSTITTDVMKKHLDIYTGRLRDVGLNLFTFIDDFIEKASKKNSISYRTIQKYRTTQNLLLEFQKEYNKEITFENINYNFRDAFIAYMENIKDYSVNNIHKHFTVLFTFLNDATVRGLNKTLTYQNRAFRVDIKKEESQNIYLTETELQQMFDLDLTDKPRLERVRDLFLVGCWTGLRFSDFSELKAENIKDDFIRIEQFKTGGVVVIPLHQMVRDILEKYENKLPKGISNQKMNDYLKELGQLVGLNEIVAKGITKGGARVVKTLEKWELLTTHTARRSFATNLYKSKFPAISIMKITGHKTEKAFLKYIKISPQENAEMLQAHWANTRPRLLQAVK